MNDNFKFKEYDWRPYSTIGLNLSIPLFKGSNFTQLKQTRIQMKPVSYTHLDVYKRQEDTGTIMGAVTLPPGTSQERAMEILNRVDSLVAAEPAVDSRTEMCIRDSLSIGRIYGISSC